MNFSSIIYCLRISLNECTDFKGEKKKIQLTWALMSSD